ncbi:MAG: type I DNA topoisomerase, partial [Micrococcales bacterium]|nr:type I DNA topoisomerase [Micrococcales bacterium]
MAKKLVIVESPAKAKTISKYLGSDYEVLASVGHIRDLAEPRDVPADKKKGPLGKFSIDIDNDFEPFYVVSPGKTKTVTDLKKALKGAEELYLATDEDREGEAIAWHLLEVLKPKVPVHRMVFNEITKDAIAAAANNTRELNDNLVEAQETRRVVDRLVGYEISPVLWRKINRGLSAGRVQSPAMRMIVQRERERIAFVSASYSSITATLNHNSIQFDAKLAKLANEKLAGSKSFDESGKLVQEVLVLSPSQASDLAKKLEGADLAVTSVEAKPSTRKPYAPFTTSTLQQEASRKLGMSAKQAMDTAQMLYQDGHITYMRTDSPALSSQAISAALAAAKELFGDDSVSPTPRIYGAKSKNAQEAHEAIRPSGETFAHPNELKSVLHGKSHLLYELIWRRTVASQMADAKLSTTTVKFETEVDGKQAEFSAAGTTVITPGFLAVYQDPEDDKKEDASAKLPILEVGQSLKIEEIASKDHSTSPPARYTEASLVKALEEQGIGRPSTYAAIISTIISKGYVVKRGSALVPEWIAFTVTRFLEENFGHLVDYAFTAKMESDLDKIAVGELDRSGWLKDFYFGDDGLQATVESLGESDPRLINTFEIAEGINLRTGKYGPYIEVMENDERRIVNIPADLSPDELTHEKAIELVNAPPASDRVLGQEPETGLDIIVKDGRYGPYITLVDEGNP